jgi:hypothetical protein
MIAGYGCIAVGFGIAYVAGALRERRALERPCAFCGKMLTPPLYACSHVIGDGRPRTASPSGATAAGLGRQYTKHSA